MSTQRNKSPSPDEAPAAVPQTTPSAIGYGHPEYQFVQAIMEMQKSLGQINSSIGNLQDSLNSVKTKVDQLVAWKNMILGGAVVLGIVISGLGYVVGKGWDYVSFKNPAQQTQVIPVPTTPAAPDKK